MRSWPSSLLEQYPFDPAGPTRHPERPWWTWMEALPGLRVPGWVRSGPVEYRFEVDGRQGMEPGAFEMMTQIDREHPLPPPGRRVGQLWSTASGDLLFVRRSPEGSFSWLVDDLGFVFLVRDLACPWLAPWSAPETKPSVEVATTGDTR